MLARTPLILSALLASAGVAFAQEAPSAEPPATDAVIESSHFAVIGLAPDDLLNLRATASATGMLIGRVAQGAMVKNLGCAEVKKTRWCKIADMDNERMQGWAAARYLQPTDMPEDIGSVGDDAAGNDGPAKSAAGALAPDPKPEEIGEKQRIDCNSPNVICENNRF